MIKYFCEGGVNLFISDSLDDYLPKVNYRRRIEQGISRRYRHQPEISKKLIYGRKHFKTSRFI